MRKCWANKLGNCAKGITGEHLISNSILPTSIVVQGFSWCRDVPKEIGSGSFVSNFLCEKHNNQLSKTDSEILNFAKAFKNFDRTMTKIKKHGFSLKKIPYTSNLTGTLIEKWFCKTLINLALVNQKEVIVDYDILDLLHLNGQ